MRILIHHTIYIFFYQLANYPYLIMYRIDNDMGIGMNPPNIVNEFRSTHVGQFHIYNVDIITTLQHVIKQLLSSAEGPDMPHAIFLHKATESFQYNFMVIYDGHRNILQFVSFQISHTRLYIIQKA